MSAETGVATAGTSAPRSLSYNPAENAVLLGSDTDNGSYELYIVPRDSKGEASPVSPPQSNLFPPHLSSCTPCTPFHLLQSLLK